MFIQCVLAMLSSNISNYVCHLNCRLKLTITVSNTLLTFVNLSSRVATVPSNSRLIAEHLCELCCFRLQLEWKEIYADCSNTLNILCEQLDPVHPGAQVQLNAFIRSPHVPPFSQGLEAQSSMSEFGKEIIFTSHYHAKKMGS